MSATATTLHPAHQNRIRHLARMAYAGKTHVLPHLDSLSRAVGADAAWTVAAQEYATLRSRGIPEGSADHPDQCPCDDCSRATLLQLRDSVRDYQGTWGQLELACVPGFDVADISRREDKRRSRMTQEARTYEDEVFELYFRDRYGD
jgi:hypothetical protein